MPVDAHELSQPHLAQVAPTALAVVDVDIAPGIFLPGMAHAFVYKPVFVQGVIAPVLVGVHGRTIADAAAHDIDQRLPYWHVKD